MTFEPYHVTLILVAVFAVLVWRRKRRQPQRFVHEGQTYFRQPDGTFTNATGALVTGALLVGSLGAAYALEQRRRASSGDGGGDSSSSDSGGWFGSSDSGSDSGGDSGGGGDGGGGD